MKLELFQKTRELGEAMLATEECKNMQEAQAALSEDSKAQELIQQFTDYQTTLQEMMQMENPDQSAVQAIANSMRTLQEELVSFPSVKAVNEAQTAFSELLQNVNQVLNFMITGEVSASDGSGCSGSCGSCAGCAAADTHLHEGHEHHHHH